MNCNSCFHGLHHHQRHRTCRSGVDNQAALMEGVTIVEISGEKLHGTGWDAIADKEIPFVVDLKTGQHTAVQGLKQLFLLRAYGAGAQRKVAKNKTGA